MTNEVIGQCICPLCKSEFEQEVRLAKTGKPYLTCEECGVQIFARQGRSAKLLRGLVSSTKPVDTVNTSPQSVEKTPEIEHVQPAKKRGFFATIMDEEVL